MAVNLTLDGSELQANYSVLNGTDPESSVPVWLDTSDDRVILGFILVTVFSIVFLWGMLFLIISAGMEAYRAKNPPDPERHATKPLRPGWFGVCSCAKTTEEEPIESRTTSRATRSATSVGREGGATSVGREGGQSTTSVGKDGVAVGPAGGRSTRGVSV